MNSVLDSLQNLQQYFQSSYDLPVFLSTNRTLLHSLHGKSLEHLQGSDNHPSSASIIEALVSESENLSDTTTHPSIVDTDGNAFASNALWDFGSLFEQMIQLNRFDSTLSFDPNESPSPESNSKVPAKPTLERECPVWNDLLLHCGTDTTSEKTKTEVQFPGPMACTLSRRTLKTLCDPHITFLAAEKSDGLRSLLYVLHEPHFPQWSVQPLPQNPPPAPPLIYFGLMDILALETALAQLLSHRTDSNDLLEDTSSLVSCVSLSKDVRNLFHPSSASMTSSFLYYLSFSSTTTYSKTEKTTESTECDPHTSKPENSFLLTLREIKGFESEAVGSFTLTRSPRPGRFFSYFIDRRADGLYLLNEELAFAPHALCSAVCDGELVMNLKQRRLSYLMFDLAGVRLWGKRQPPGGCVDSSENRINPSNGFVAPSCTFHALGRDGVTSLRARVRLLDRVLIEGHYAAHAMRNTNLPKSLQLLPKTYFRLSELPALVAKLERTSIGDNEKGETGKTNFDETKQRNKNGFHHRYTYEGHHWNDGIIFAPDSPEFYPFVPRSVPLLLKWKWPEAETVDWWVQSSTAAARGGSKKEESEEKKAGVKKSRFSSRGSSEAASSSVMHALYFHIKKYQKGTVAFSEHVRYKTTLLDVTALGISPSSACFQNGCVVECGWDSSRARWVAKRLRPEKKNANAFHTAFSVLEAITEQLELPELLSHIQSSSSGNASFLKPNSETHSPVLTSNPDFSPSSHPLPYTCLPETYFYLRASVEKSKKILIHLQTLVKTKAQRHPLPMNLLELSSCVGLNTNSHEMLFAVLLLALANHGGSVTYSRLRVRAYFEPRTGSWVLTQLVGECGQKGNHHNPKVEATSVLNHLEAQAVVLGQDPEVVFVGEKGEMEDNEEKEEMKTIKRLEDETQRRDHGRFSKEKGEREFENREDTQQNGWLIPKGVFPHIPEKCFYHDVKAHSSCSSSSSAAAAASVFHHYDNRAREQNASCSATESAIRSVNNFIKTVLISEATKYWRNAAHLSDRPQSHPIVFDLACGRGGDLYKWKEVNPAYVVLIDGAFHALAAAAGRYAVGKGLSTNSATGGGIEVQFHCADCFREDLNPILESLLKYAPRGELDMVACQFSLHYAFESEATVRQMLHNVTCKLKSGGLFIGTVIEDTALAKYLAQKEAKGWQDVENSENEDGFSFSVDPCGEKWTKSNLSDASSWDFGQSYRFSLGTSVQGEEEYVVPWEKFLAMASEYGLVNCLAADNFETWFVNAFSQRSTIQETPRGSKDNEIKCSSSRSPTSLFSFLEEDVSDTKQYGAVTSDSFASLWQSHYEGPQLELLKCKKNRRRSSSCTSSYEDDLSETHPVSPWESEVVSSVRSVCGLYRAFVFKKS